MQEQDPDEPYTADSGSASGSTDHQYPLPHGIIHEDSDVCHPCGVRAF